MKPFLCALVLVLAGCASAPKDNLADPMPRYGKGIQIARMDVTQRSPSTKLDMIQGELTRPHRVIATLYRECNAQDAGLILNAIAWNARQLGADGLLIPPAPPQTGKVNVNVQVGQYVFGGGRDRSARLIAHAFVYE